MVKKRVRELLDFVGGSVILKLEEFFLVKKLLHSSGLGFIDSLIFLGEIMIVMW